MNDAFIKWVKKRFGPNVKAGEPMSRHTTLGVGGPAGLFVSVDNTEGLGELLARCNDEGVDFFILGGGSNLLVRDGGMDGVVIDMKKGWKEISISADRDGEVVVAAGAGLWLQAVCRYAIEQGLSGMNFALGIPGSVGGAVVMNAGTSSGNMGDVVDAIEIVTRTGSVEKKKRPELDFSYRRFSVKGLGSPESGGFAVTMAKLVLKHGDRGALRDEANEILRRRLVVQPVDKSSAGCFFRNPSQGESAGRLIEMAGLKGMTIGGAAVSEKHANFFVNRGDATASDFIRLMEVVQDRVSDLFGIDLEPEVIIVG